jgi:hypothetical protein
MSKSLLSQIVSEIFSTYPNASRDDIVNALASSLEKEILPNAIRAVILPSPPSKMRILLEKKHEERRKIHYRKSMLEDKIRFSQNLDYLKHRLSLEENDDTILKQRVTNGDFDDILLRPYASSSTPSSRRYVAKGERAPLPEALEFERSGSRFGEDKSNPYTKSITEGMIGPQFLIDDEIRDKISSDSLFMAVIASTEIFLRNFAKDHLGASFNVQVKRDLEIPAWEKIIVRLTLPGMDLDEKMRVWDHVDMELRKTLRQIAIKDDPAERERLEEISKRLFTHVDL